MTLPERIAFTWLLAWGMMEAFLPPDPGLTKALYSFIPAFGTAYLNDAHGKSIKWIKRALKKE